MCGIAGFINPSSGEELLNRQLGAIFHRGPDGDGRFSHAGMHLGMRRLSIIDLAGGWQPLLSREGRVVAFQNGEIYNFRELRVQLEARGYVFRTRSDTEILAHGYDAWGIEGLLERLDGMYAICIADLDSRKLHLARDRFGEKPLYFAYSDGAFVYGSSLRSVAIAPWLDLEINPWAIERYFACHFVAGSQTVLKGVNRLLPGERLEIPIDASQAPVVARYYRPRLEKPRPASVDELEALLEEAIESRLVADVPMGIFLSGGIDSSLIAAIAARNHPEVESFCMAFDDVKADESIYAKAVADHFGIKLNTIRFTASSFMELLPTVCSALDEPIGDQAILPVHWLSHMASERVKVVLSGEGADEVFGGYGYYADAADLLAGDFKAAYATAHGEYGNAQGLLVEPLGQTQAGFPLLTYRHERDALVPATRGQPDAFELELTTWLATAHDPLQRKCAADLASWLTDDLLIKADRMTMAASIEGRAPFLSPRIVERGLAMPQHQKFGGGQSKVLLRELARKLLPASVVDRKKHGFVLPMGQWVQDWIEACGGFERYLVRGEGLGIDADALLALYSNPNSRNRERLWFAVIVLFEWWQSFRQSVNSGQSAVKEAA